MQPSTILRRHASTGAKRTLPALLAAVLAVALLLIQAPRALAEEDGGNSNAKTLVLQAVALVANRVETDRVVEGIDAALAAPEQDGVNRAMVEQALGVVKGLGGGASDADVDAAMVKAQALMQRSIGIPTSVTPNYATGEDTGTTVVLGDFQPPRGISDGGDVALAVIALAAIAGGLFLARRLRPEHSVRELRRRAAAVKGA
jgi:hypothetical protein